MIFGKFSLNGSGVVRATVETPSTTGIVNGAAYLDDEQGDSYACVSTAAVNAADGFIGGFRYTTAGALRVSDVTAGIPASNSINQGILMTDNGQVCFSGAAGTATINGVSVTADGAVSMQVMAFLAEFEDLGAGAVDTAVTFGNVAATFTRATAATTVGPTGLVISVATGVARSYYDPTSLAYLGYLAEGARTNLALSSEDLRSAAAGNPVTEWTNTDTTVTVAGTTAPDGNLDGNLLTEGSAGTAVVSHAITVTADVTHSTARFIKRGNTDWVRFVVLQTGTGANNVAAWFNLATGVAGTVQSNGTATGGVARIKSYTNGWYRCEIAGAINNGATDVTAFTASADADTSTTRVASSTRYEWGAQFENNVAFASSYIPTTTAAVARNADVLTYPTTGWLNAAAGTIYLQTIGSPDTAGAARLVVIDDGTTNERFNISSFSNLTYLVVDGNVTQSSLTFGAIANAGAVKIAAAYAANDFAGSLNGGTVGTDTSGTLPTVDTLRIANRSGVEQPFTPIARVAYFPSRLPNATLQSLTA